jgi:YHS domain-containing protein/thiol-disulfide isomerase/thioredoxin
MRALSFGLPAATVALFLTSACLAADGFAWESDLESARQVAARTNRLLLIHFGAPWCQPCQQLERDVFSQPGFGKELKATFVGVKLNHDSFPATARQYGVQSIPTDVVLTPQGQLVERIQSPTNAADYVAAMKRIEGLARRGSLAGDTQIARQPASADPFAAAGGAGRYANYTSGQQPGAVPAPSAQMQPAPASAGAPGAAGPVAPPAANGSQLASAPAQQGSAVAVPGALQTASQPAAAAVARESQAWPPQLPPGNAPLGLDGQCPVTLVERQHWTRGDTHFGMQHQGRTYLFAGPDELRRFQENPNLYSPVMSGDDPVLALDQRVSVPGNRMYGVFCAGHVYLFANEQSLQQFKQNPKRYAAAALEARR